MAVGARTPPPAPGVSVTRQRGAAAGRAHPAAAAPGPSKREARRERRRAEAGAWPGEAAGAEGAGASPGGPQRTLGACLSVWVAGVLGLRAGACGSLRDRACCGGSRVDSAPVRALPAGLGLCWTVCVSARVCVEGQPGVYLRMCWAVIVPAPGAGRRPAPAQSLLRWDIFQTGFLRGPALLQPEREGGAPPPQASRDPGGPGTAD